MRTIRNKVWVFSFLTIVLFFLLTPPVYASSDALQIKSSEVIQGDKLAGGSSIRNEGKIQGDLYAFTGDLFSTGLVEGDLLAVAGQMNVPGRVLGDLRAFAGSTSITGNIDKNVNLFAGKVFLDGASYIGRNAYLVGGQITIDGIIAGNAIIASGDITIGGEIWGDTRIWAIDHEGEKKSAKITILPSAKIHGQLIYHSKNQADIHPEAAISDIVWEKDGEPGGRPSQSPIAAYFQYLHRFAVTIAIYFGMAMILYRLFPKVLARQVAVIDQKTSAVVGTGLIVLLSSMVILLFLIILFALSFIILFPAAFTLISFLITGYTILLYFSGVPVSMWIGNKLLQDKANNWLQFAVGLFILSFTTALLNLLSKIAFPGYLFEMVNVLISLIVVILGTGSMLLVMRETYTRSREAGII